MAAARTPPLQGREVYLAAPLADDHATVRFLCTDVPAVHITSHEASDPAALVGNELLLLVPPELQDWGLSLLPRNRLLHIWQGGQIQIDKEPSPHVFYLAYSSHPPEAVPRNGGLYWTQGVELVGYGVEVLAPQEIVLNLYWRTSQPLQASYTVFAHILRDGVLTAQHDGEPASGLYPTDRWRVGDIVQDQHRISLDSPYDPVLDQIEVGLYGWWNMEHLNLLAPGGEPTAETRIVLP